MLFLSFDNSPLEGRVLSFNQKVSKGSTGKCIPAYDKLFEVCKEFPFIFQSFERGS